MKIGIDVTPLGLAHHDKGGVYHYIINLLNALKGMDQESEYIIWFHFFNNINLGRFKEVCKSFGFDDISNFRVKRSYLPNYRGWFLKLPIELFTGLLNVYHGPAHFVMPTVKGKSVVTIHDTDFLDIPEYLDPQWVAYKDKFTRLSVRRAGLIITVSHYIKNKIIRRLKVPSNKIRVIYHGISKHFYPNKDESLIKRITGKYDIMSPYILFVGTFHENKNLIRLLEAFKHLKISAKLPHRLVLAGGKGRLSEDVLDSIVKLKLTELVSLPEYISDEDLPVLYNGADSFVFPSLFEGFGMPVLEAMACGTPVITSNVCSLPEVSGDAALQIDPYSTDSIAEGIYKVLMDRRLHNELVSRGLERAKRFSWEKTTKETLNVYRELGQL